jgi:hypothetical protein
LKLLF